MCGSRGLVAALVWDYSVRKRRYRHGLLVSTYVVREAGYRLLLVCPWDQARGDTAGEPAGRSVVCEVSRDNKVTLARDKVVDTSQYHCPVQLILYD